MKFMTAPSMYLAGSLAAIVLVSGCASAPSVDPNDYEGSVKVDDLFIVDCLLPPQVRQLGQNYTYLAARQPIRTSAKNCAIRGGEYVAYDRASMATALKVWLPAAEGGDAKAQTYVAEIYENGMGVDPDYATAARWYQKAAEQGDSRAMIGLGNLYESGRGVAKSTTQAMNWYRKASGITDGILELSTHEQIQERRRIAEEAEQLREQVISLTAALDDNEKALQRRKRDLARAQKDLQATLAELQKEQAQNGQISAQDLQAMESLQAENAMLRQRLSSAESARSSLTAELASARQKAEEAEIELSFANTQLSERKASMQESERQLNTLKQNLVSARSSGAASDELALLQARITEQENALEDERALLNAQQKELADKLQSAQAKLEEARNRERRMQAQLDNQADEIDMIRGSLTATQTQLSNTQMELAQADEAILQVTELQNEIAERELEITRYEQESMQLVSQLDRSASTTTGSSGAPQISMISPQVATARGIKSVTLFSDVNEYELIGRVTPRDDILSFKVNDSNALAEIDSNGIFQVRVPINSAGDTPVSIEAVRQNGDLIVENFMIQKEVADEVKQRNASPQLIKRMKSDLGEYHALVIGNNNYSDHARLTTAVNDATEVANVLRNRYGYKTTLLTNATQVDIVAAMANLTQTLDKNDNLLVYYAGHGVVDETSGEGYWLGIDAGKTESEGWIANEQISKFMSEVAAKHVLVVADSCYSGTLSGSSVQPLPLDINDQDLLFISRVKARTVLTSGGLVPVVDDGGNGHSIFGGAFIKALTSNSGLTEGYRLMETLRSEVENRSRLARVRQVPQYSAMKFAGHEGSEFFFLSDQSASASLAGHDIRL